RQLLLAAAQVARVLLDRGRSDALLLEHVAHRHVLLARQPARLQHLHGARELALLDADLPAGLADRGPLLGVDAGCEQGGENLVGLALFQVAVHRDPRTRDHEQAGGQHAARAQQAQRAEPVADNVHGNGLRRVQDCCRNNCCTPSEVRLATFAVSCDWNRNWWHWVVSWIICPGVISVALADIALDNAWTCSAVPLRLSKAWTIIFAPADSPAGAVVATCASAFAAAAAPPVRSNACANSRTSTAEACGCSAGAAAGTAAASSAATWIASIITCLLPKLSKPRRRARVAQWPRLRITVAALRLLLARDRVQRLGDAVLRGGRVVGHELHLQAGGGERDHLRGLVGTGADLVGQFGDVGRLGVERLPPGARHRLVPAGAARTAAAADVAGARPVLERGRPDVLVDEVGVGWNRHRNAPVASGDRTPEATMHLARGLSRLEL